MVESVDFLFQQRRRDFLEKHFSAGKEDFEGLFQDYRSYLELKTLLYDAGFKGYNSDIENRNVQLRELREGSIDLLIEADLDGLNHGNEGKDGLTILNFKDEVAMEQFCSDYDEWIDSKFKYDHLTQLKEEDSRNLFERTSGKGWLFSGAFASAYALACGILLYEDVGNTRDFFFNNPYQNIPLVLAGLAGVTGLAYLFQHKMKEGVLRQETLGNGLIYTGIERDFKIKDSHIKKDYLDKALYGRIALEKALTLVPLK